MNKIWKFFQYGYLMVAFICIIEAIMRWNSDRQRAYFFFGFAIFTTLVFFFKRRFRKKVQERNNKKK
jgi:FtsH-binding integral membrane protein